jgi:hypothetical protein
MSLFTSVRERRLWLWTLLVVIGIYATLNPARALAGALHDLGLISASVWLALFMTGAAVVSLGLKARPRGVEIGVALGIAAVYLLVFVRMAVPPEERTHLFEYSIVGALIYQALIERWSNGRRVPTPAVFAVMLTALVGWLDEGIQWLLPNRVYDPFDILVNFLAGLMAVVANVALGWARLRPCIGRGSCVLTEISIREVKAPLITTRIKLTPPIVFSAAP